MRTVRLLVLLAPLAAAALLLTPVAAAQEPPPYDHPLFTGPIYTAPEAPYDARHLDLSLRLAPGAPVRGEAHLILVLTAEGVTAVPFLAEGLSVDAAWSGPAGGDLAPSAHRRDGDTLFVTLAPPPPDSLAGLDGPDAPDSLAAAAYRTSDLVAVRIRYATARAADRDGWWTPALGRAAARFPAPLTPGDRVTAVLTVDAPEAWTVIAPGAKTEANDGGGRTSSRFDLPDPLRPDDLLIAAGGFSVTTDDVAALGGRTSLSAAVPARRAETARTFAAAPHVLRAFASYLDVRHPWPAARLAAVPADAAPPRAVAAGGGVGLLADRLLVDDASAAEAPDREVAEMLARAWFGGLVGAVDPRDAWFEDAAATHLAARLVADGAAGDAAFDLLLLDLADRYFDEARTYRRPLVWDQFTHPAQLRDAHAAAKGAWVLHMLRARIGDDAFRDGLRRFLRTHAYTDVGTEALESAFRSHTREDVGAFFGQWVYAAGHPVLEVEPVYDADAERLRVTVRQVQSGYLVPAAFEVPLSLEVHTLFGERRFDLALSSAEETFTLDVPMDPRFVVVDPHGVLLAEVRLAQDAPAWVAQLRYAPSAPARLRAARALVGHRDDPALLVGLAGAFAGEAVPAVRRAIVETMASLPRAASLLRALTAAADDPDADVRAAAVAGLGGFTDDDEAAARALAAAESDPSSRVVAAAVRALAEMGAPVAADVVRAALVTPSHRERVRVAAFDVLHRAGLPADGQRDLGLAYSTSDAAPEVRAAALRFLAEHFPGAGGTLSRLRDALSDPRLAPRTAALEGLAALGTDGALALLRAHLADEPDLLLRARWAPWTPVE